jgi:hypothetical protein
MPVTMVIWFRDVQRRQHRGSAHGQSASQARRGELRQRVRDGRADRRDREQQTGNHQHAPPPEAVAQPAGHAGAEDAAEQQAAGGHLGLDFRQVQLRAQEDQRAVDHRDVEAEQQARGGGHDGGHEDVQRTAAVHVHSRHSIL